MPVSVKYITFLSVLLLLFHGASAQLNNSLNPSEQQQNMFDQGKKDTSKVKLGVKWKEEKTKIHYNFINSQVNQSIDTSLDRFHRFQPVQPWWGRDLGNYGTAIINQFFTPNYQPGLSLGYHVYDMYKINVDSLKYYNTTRPYSEFSFLLGSKLQQNASILHTQNITPKWNFAGALNSNTSGGFFKYQNTNNISGSFTSKYKSENQKYNANLGFVYNRFRQAENGGVTDLNQLTEPGYSERSLVGVNLPSIYNSGRAAVSNVSRDVDLLYQHSYSFGLTDTVYNKDSTGYTVNFTPRFSLKHQLRFHTERHIFQDSAPSTERYAFAGDITFNTIDAVRSVHNWQYVDNKFSLNGYIGKLGQQLLLEAGLGNRLDWFNNDNSVEVLRTSSIGNYVFGTIKKEALKPKEWAYEAQASLFFTGDALGNFNVQAFASKDLGKWGLFSGGVRQVLTNAPFSYSTFITNHFERFYTLNKISLTQLQANVHIPKIRVNAGVRNNLIANYLYYNSDLEVVQQSEAFSVLQVYGRKEFKFGWFSLDNEVVWQQATANAPLNLPALLLRHRLGIQTHMFKSALMVATGIEIRYNTPYFADGYSPYFNQFYYQNEVSISNYPELLAYANFKIRSFRAFVMIDQLQQFVSNNVLFAPNYPGPNATFRFGFNWPLVN